MRRNRTPSRDVYYSTAELRLALCIVAGLDPKVYKHDEAKALIHKSKAVLLTGESVVITDA